MIDISQLLFEELSANAEDNETSSSVSSDVSSNVSADVNQDELRKIASETFANVSTTDYKSFAKKTDTAPCKMSLLNIVAQLHAKAYEKALGGSKDFQIINSAIEGTNLKSAKFYGPGKHILAVVQKKKTNDGGMTPAEARKYLAEYVKWFAGPDISFTEKEMMPFASNDNAETKTVKVKTNKNNKTDNDKSDDSDNSDELSEAVNVISFREFIRLNEAGEGDSETAGTDKATTTSDKTDKNDLKKAAETRAEGWYISYRFLIEGVPEKTFSDSVKNFMSTVTSLGLKLLSGIGVQSFDWRTGSRGEMHTIGDMVDALNAVFGKLNPDELLSSYDKKFKQKFPKNDAISRIIDTPTILKQKSIKNNIEKTDSTKIQKAKYALCTRITKEDPSYKLYNQKVIAELVTSAISGIFKQFKNKVYPEDVIFVNNYSDNTREKKKYIDTDRTTGSVADSITQHYTLPMLNEEADTGSTDATDVKAQPTSNKRDIEKIKNEIQSYVDNLLSNEPFGKNAKFNIAKSKTIIQTLKDNSVTDEELNAELSKHEYGYQLTIDAVNESTDVMTSLMQKLFEDTSNNVNQTNDWRSRVEKIFKNMFIKFKSYATVKNVISSPTLYDFNIREQTVNESIAQQIFDDIKSKLAYALNEAAELDNRTVKALNSKLYAEIQKAQKGGKQGISPATYTVFGSLSNVKQYLNDKGLFNSSIFDDDSEDVSYGVVVFKKPIDAKHSADGKKHGATVGYNNINKSVIADKFALAIGETVDEQMYTQTANDKFCYNKSKVPANCDVYVAKFKNEDVIKHVTDKTPPEDETDPDGKTKPTDDEKPTPTPTDDEKNPTKKQPGKIYVVADVNGFLDNKDKPSDTENQSDTAHTDYDFYIVPMAGLDYRENISTSSGK